MFELVIVLADNPYAPKLPPADALMSTTIARIVADFFETRKRVFVYVCDDSDSKTDSRRKLFDRWFERFRQKKYVKLSIPLAVEHNGNQYFAEFVTRSDNPYFAPLYDSFNRKVSGNK